MFILIGASALFGIFGYIASGQDVVMIPVTIAFISAILLVYGVVVPEMALFVKSRSGAVSFYGVMMIVCFVLVGYME
ncbi:hypothetical protein [Paenibacillus silvisoli]|uniref:hypothetical protein n=1 Tax=Paenibacillus silvisoli TaxID=3110539 RepID=UPI002804D82A|nr:hypothetical protein [Paenibacillus silvisoli]